MWWRADERQTGHIFEYNLREGIYRINSLSGSEISPLCFPAPASVTLHTAVQLRLLTCESVLSLLSTWRQCMHAYAHKGLSHVNRWTLYMQ